MKTTGATEHDAIIRQHRIDAIQSGISDMDGEEPSFTAGIPCVGCRGGDGFVIHLT